MKALLSTLGVAWICVVLVLGCQSRGGAGGRSDGNTNANTNANASENDNAATNDNAPANSNENDNGVVNDNAANENENDNTTNDNGENDNAINDNSANDNSVNDNTVDENDNTDGGDPLGIQPGVGAAEVALGDETADVEATLGTPDGVFPPGTTGGPTYQYDSGVIVMFDSMGIVQTLILQAPFAGTTPGGNGIGSTLDEFRQEFGFDDVPDEADNYRIWEDDGIAASPDPTGTIRLIQISSVI